MSTRKLILYLIEGILALGLGLLFACNWEPKPPSEVHKLLADYSIPLTEKEIDEALMQEPLTSPCTWDLDLSGRVTNDDLLLLLTNYGEIYVAESILEFLSVYGEEYIVDVIPLWNNYIQDVNCGLDWSNFPAYKCDGTLVALPIQYIDSLHWIANDSIIWTDPVELNWLSYPPAGINCPDTTGYPAPCNGVQTITQRLFLNGRSYSRTNTGYASMNNSPVGLCPGSLEDIEWMSQEAEEYGNLQFLD